MEPDDPFTVPVPQGELLGEVPGVFGVLGLAVDGCVVLPGVELFGDVDPGVVVFGVPAGRGSRRGLWSRGSGRWCCGASRWGCGARGWSRRRTRG